MQRDVVIVKTVVSGDAGAASLELIGRTVHWRQCIHKEHSAGEGCCDVAG